MTTTVRRVSLAMVKREEKAEVGGFSEPSKMPWLSYSTPAADCRVGSRLREVPGSVCEGCYASKGRYLFGNVKNSMRGRADAIANNPNWVADMASHINRRCDLFVPTYEGERPAFRWHDSGDIYSVQHLADICEIARQCPGVDFWLPTREYADVETYFSQGGTCPPNLTIRLSAHMVDGPAPVALARKWGLTVSTVHDEGQYDNANNCPAYTQGGQCLSCRSCWDRDVFHVSYPAH